jgi:hypothetical protein
LHKLEKEAGAQISSDAKNRKSQQQPNALAPPGGQVSGAQIKAAAATEADETSEAMGTDDDAGADQAEDIPAEEQISPPPRAGFTADTATAAKGAPASAANDTSAKQPSIRR